MKREERFENLPGVRHRGPFTIFKRLFRNFHQCVVLDKHPIWIIVESQIDFRFLPTTNVFVSFITNILADQNFMSCAGVDLTLHFRDEALTGLQMRNMNLN